MIAVEVEGTQTLAGDSGRAETPQELALRRLSAAPRKAKCLQRKSTAPFRKKSRIFNKKSDPDTGPLFPFMKPAYNRSPPF
ncbi:hypothetical protein FZD51_23370 [Bacillus infantis]|uniref:Uncharacterized protein n=1 Tax=Bacillus infantis TaxID=324767 RepID=A0A5D4QWG6_9BACI|nr:hypothetical protein FZD51_23370 [Bacillus infantis]